MKDISVKIISGVSEREIKILKSIYNKINRTETCFESDDDFFRDIVVKDRKSILWFWCIGIKITANMETLRYMRAVKKMIAGSYVDMSENIVYSPIPRKDFIIDEGIASYERIKDNFYFYEESQKLGLSEEQIFNALPKYSKIDIYIKCEVGGWIDLLRYLSSPKFEEHEIKQLAFDIARVFKAKIPYIF